MLPDVNAAWLAQGRQLRNQDGHHWQLLNLILRPWFDWVIDYYLG